MGKGRDLGRRVRRSQTVDEKLKAAKRKEEKKLKSSRQVMLATFISMHSPRS
jgi:hypothetical protein